MPIEQRVVSSSKSKNTKGGPAIAELGDADPKVEKKSSSKTLVFLIVLLALVNLAVLAFLVLRPGAQAPVEPTAEPTVQVGEVVADESALSVNLARGHFLRIGFALQLSAEVEEVDLAEARDAVIDLYSGREMGEVNSPEGRKSLKAALLADLNERYGEGSVLDVYLTEYVTQ